ncbi:MAG: hypothetical protein IKU34_11770 [Clostridia bacterium]|nr:hypothetical protein [Clostridia bacterium]
MDMNTKPFSFSLDTLDHAIVEALRESLENIMPDIMTDNNLSERLAYGQFRWNVIIAQLKDKCQHLGWLDLGLCKRGSWKTPVLFYPQRRYIFTLMTEDTFSGIQRRKDKGNHYLCAAADFNQNVQPQYEQTKLDLPPVEDAASQWIAKSKEQLSDAVKVDVGDINGHILVLFDTQADQLISVRAVRLTSKLEISTEEENWTKYIQMPYSATQTVIPSQNDDTEDEALVELL